MAITKPAVLPPWAESGDAVQPTNAEIQSGWQAGSVPPSRQRFNWILNYCMNGVRYLVRRGLADWDAAETYAIGDRVIGPTGSTYQALTTNTNKTPASNPSDWALWAFGPSDVATLTTDNSSKLATTSWIRSAMSNIASAAGFSVLLSANGYIALPSWLGGLIIQWGNSAAVSAGGSLAVTLPMTFPNNFWLALATRYSNAPGTSAYAFWAYPTSNSSVTIFNGTAASLPGSYIAIGR